jgi:hypothetical protein
MVYALLEYGIHLGQLRYNHIDPRITSQLLKAHYVLDWEACVAITNWYPRAKPNDSV